MPGRGVGAEWKGVHCSLCIAVTVQMQGEGHCDLYLHFPTMLMPFVYLQWRLLLILGHFPSSVNLKFKICKKHTTFRKLALLPSSSKTTQLRQLDLSERANHNPRTKTVVIVKVYKLQPSKNNSARQEIASAPKNCKLDLMTTILSITLLKTTDR
jgi:hypothetical protein